MSNKNTGGPAFPCDNIVTRNGKGHIVEHVSDTGMTLRDYFAAKALQGLLASDVNAPLEQFAYQSYLAADEMLKARET